VGWLIVVLAVVLVVAWASRNRRQVARAREGVELAVPVPAAAVASIIGEAYCGCTDPGDEGTIEVISRGEAD